MVCAQVLAWCAWRPGYICKRFALRSNRGLESSGKTLKHKRLVFSALGLQIALTRLTQKSGLASRSSLAPQSLGGAGMHYKETFWMACDSTEQLRAEYGPFHTRAEAEAEARKLGFSYLLRYEHLLDENEEIQEVRCIFLELPGAPQAEVASISLHTRCVTCGAAASHD